MSLFIILNLFSVIFMFHNRVFEQGNLDLRLYINVLLCYSILSYDYHVIIIIIIIVIFTILIPMMVTMEIIKCSLSSLQHPICRCMNTATVATSVPTAAPPVGSRHVCATNDTSRNTASAVSTFCSFYGVLLESWQLNIVTIYILVVNNQIFT